jgi:uncharacterized protein
MPQGVEQQSPPAPRGELGHLDLSRIAQDLQIRKVQVEAVVQLLDEGNTIPFITRYRKERTGGLDEELLRIIQERVAQLRQLADRKQTILRSIEGQGKLTDVLRAAILAADNPKRLEDLYLPYKPKKRTLAQAARDKGLENLAMYLWRADDVVANLVEVLPTLVNPEQELHTPDDVLLGAQHILAELIAETADVRAALRAVLWDTGVLVTTRSDKLAEGQGLDYKDYFNFREAVRQIPPHRILAINRGEKDNALTARLEWDTELGRRLALERLPLPDSTGAIPPPSADSHRGHRGGPPPVNRLDDLQKHPHREFIGKVTEDALGRLLVPSLEREIRRELTHRSEGHAVGVFARNLRSKLLAAPLHGRRVLAIDPGFRNGCKLAVLDETGNLLDHGVVFPHAPQNKKGEARNRLEDMVRRHQVQVIAIGNGTACRETEELVSELIAVVEARRLGLPIPGEEQSVAGRSQESGVRGQEPGATVAAAPVPEVAPVAPIPEAGPLPEVPATPEAPPAPPIQPVLDGQAVPGVEEVTPPAEAQPIPVPGAELAATPTPDSSVPQPEPVAVSAPEPAVEPGAPAQEAAPTPEPAPVEQPAPVQAAALPAPAPAEQPAPVQAAAPPAPAPPAEPLPDAPAELAYVIVNEAGASVYSASPIGREEFPEFDANLRGTISIGRRLQDPLSELVKIDPQHVGVGLYQHDVSPKQLKESLEAVIESCVNTVGVDLNTASVPLLRHVSGLNQLVARELVDFRKSHGSFRTREQLREVNGIGEARWVQAAGFLKIRGGDNPLDGTWIHPESYGVATQLLAELGYGPDIVGDRQRIGELQEKLQALAPEEVASRLQVGVPTVKDIIEALARPGRDPREDLPPPVFKKGILKLEDLQPGMELKGTVLNVVDFGAFIDIGLKDSGLVHISQMANRYVKSPYDVVAVGDVVNVWVLSVDKERHRVSLTMIQPGTERKPPERRPGPRRDVARGDHARGDQVRGDHAQRGEPVRGEHGRGEAGRGHPVVAGEQARGGEQPRGEQARRDQGRGEGGPRGPGGPGRQGGGRPGGGRPGGPRPAPVRRGQPALPRGQTRIGAGQQPRGRGDQQQQQPPADQSAGTEAQGAAGAGEQQSPPAQAQAQPTQPARKPKRNPPRPQLSQAALAGKESLSTFGELAAFWEAKQQPTPEAPAEPGIQQQPPPPEPNPNGGQPREG